MGWSSGAGIVEALIKALVDNKVSSKRRRNIYERVVYDVMYDMDLDNEDEVLGIDREYDKFYFDHNVSECFSCGKRLNVRNLSEDQDLCKSCYREELEDEYEEDDDDDCLVRL